MCNKAFYTYAAKGQTCHLHQHASQDIALSHYYSMRSIGGDFDRIGVTQRAVTEQRAVEFAESVFASVILHRQEAEPCQR